MPAPAERLKATTYRRDSREIALGWLHKLTHVPLAIAILLVNACWRESAKPLLFYYSTMSASFLADQMKIIFYKQTMCRVCGNIVLNTRTFVRVNGQKSRWDKKARGQKGRGTGRPAFLTPLGHEGVIAYTRLVLSLPGNLITLD